MITKDKVIPVVVVTIEFIAAASIAGAQSDGGVGASIHVLAGVIMFLGLELIRTWRMVIRTSEMNITQISQEANEAGFNEGFMAATAEDTTLWEEGCETCLQSKS